MSYLIYLLIGCISSGLITFALCYIGIQRSLRELHGQVKTQSSVAQQCSTSGKELQERINHLEQLVASMAQQSSEVAAQTKQQFKTLAYLEQRLLALELLRVRASTVLQLAERLAELESHLKFSSAESLEARVAALEHVTKQSAEPALYNGVLSLIQDLVARIKVMEANDQR